MAIKVAMKFGDARIDETWSQAVANLRRIQCLEFPSLNMHYGYTPSCDDLCITFLVSMYHAFSLKTGKNHKLLYCIHFSMNLWLPSFFDLDPVHSNTARWGILYFEMLLDDFLSDKPSFTSWLVVTGT